MQCIAFSLSIYLLNCIANGPGFLVVSVKSNISMCLEICRIGVKTKARKTHSEIHAYYLVL